MLAAKVFLAVILAPALLFAVAAGVVVAWDRLIRLLQGRPANPPLPAGRPPSLYDRVADWEIEWLLIDDPERWVER